MWCWYELDPAMQFMIAVTTVCLFFGFLIILVEMLIYRRSAMFWIGKYHQMRVLHEEARSIYLEALKIISKDQDHRMK